MSIERITTPDGQFLANYLAPEDRHNGKSWPTSVTFRGQTFFLHNELENNTAWYDAAAGPSQGELVVTKDGRVVGGHDAQFRNWIADEDESPIK